MVICHMTAHRVTERKVGVRNRADSRNFAVIDFRALRAGEGGQHPESFLYVSTAARAGEAEGSPRFSGWRSWTIAQR